jgi:hypothetical protein
MMRAEAIGWRAHAALTASGGVATVTALLSRSLYAEATGEMIWIGGLDALLHARAVLVTRVFPCAAGASVHIALTHVEPWRPAMPRHRRGTATTAAHALRTEPETFGSARGLARLLNDDAHDDPVLARAAPHARALATACAHDDARAATEAARPLLGLGDGLTPAGDDYVGGVLFARSVFGEVGPAWEAAIARILIDAAALTHPISARLLTDLTMGEGWAPLHELVNALGAGDTHAAHLAAQQLTTLGDTSGWNLLAGVIAGLTPGVPAARV